MPLSGQLHGYNAESRLKGSAGEKPLSPVRIMKPSSLLQAKPEKMPHE